MTENPNKNLAAKYDKLREILQSFQKVIVSYSGGVDSVFLLKAALDCLGPDNVLACIGVSQSLARSEYEAALQIAQDLGAPLEIVHPREMSNPDYKANSANRCFYCKTAIYSLLNDLARDRGFDAILAGTNLDDLGDFRPGLQAARDFHVLSPLQEAQLTKQDIRTLSKQLNLPTWNKPAQPCLASRLTYGLEVTPDRLKQIEQGEAFLRSLGLTELRVRHHDHLVRIEVPPDKISLLLDDRQRTQIVDYFKELGFTYVSLDLEGFRSGSANEALE